MVGRHTKIASCWKEPKHKPHYLAFRISFHQLLCFSADKWLSKLPHTAHHDKSHPLENPFQNFSKSDYPCALFLMAWHKRNWDWKQLSPESGESRRCVHYRFVLGSDRCHCAFQWIFKGTERCFLSFPQPITSTHMYVFIIRTTKKHDYKSLLGTSHVIWQSRSMDECVQQLHGNLQFVLVFVLYFINAWRSFPFPSIKAPSVTLNFSSSAF